MKLRCRRLTKKQNWAVYSKSKFGKLPPELRIKIFKLAMQATGGIVFMPCLTDRAFKPNIAVGLLRTW